ncbi:hypothetical protein SADUNF_Sadunf07G0084300 [Salix dunnii]|uniref:Uncharacterized protein n=1 Tax=Salix dunnii TaxID=1413687 RepID=A0A835K3W7_9ROSI|nr:hypothetical protein SADUNF_Sadunf07G0084300 [Salix dunnii]
MVGLVTSCACKQKFNAFLANNETGDRGLIDYCREKMTHFMTAKNMAFKDELPIASVGKIYYSRVTLDYIMTSRRQRLRPGHHFELYPIEIENSSAVASSSGIQNAHQSMFEYNACIDFQDDDHHATIGLASSLALQPEIDRLADASMYAASSSNTFPSSMANYQDASNI